MDISIKQGVGLGCGVVAACGLLLLAAVMWRQHRMATDPEYAARDAARVEQIRRESAERDAAREEEQKAAGAGKWEEYRTGSSDARYDAYAAARELVRGLLKAPSTADFARYDAARIRIDDRGRFVVLVEVDAQNSFGAVIRSRFVCPMTVEPGPAWSGECSLLP